MIVIFVGDKPSPHMKPNAPAFQGALCEARLKRWINKIVNPDTDEVYIYNRGDLDLRAWIIISLSNPNVVLIALGTQASMYLSKMGVAYYALPHPSGRNRQINDKPFITRALKNAVKYLESRQKLKKATLVNHSVRA